MEEKNLFFRIFNEGCNLGLCEAAMPTLEALLHLCGREKMEKGNCKLSVERSGGDNLQSAEACRQWHKICGRHKANEKFSGKGYTAYICKAYSRLSAAEKAVVMNRLMNFQMQRFTAGWRKWLEASRLCRHKGFKDRQQVLL